MDSDASHNQHFLLGKRSLVVSKRPFSVHRRRRYLAALAVFGGVLWHFLAAQVLRFTAHHSTVTLLGCACGGGGARRSATSTTVVDDISAGGEERAPPASISTLADRGKVQQEGEIKKRGSGRPHRDRRRRRREVRDSARSAATTERDGARRPPPDRTTRREVETYESQLY